MSLTRISKAVAPIPLATGMKPEKMPGPPEEEEGMGTQGAAKAACTTEWFCGEALVS